MRSVLNLWVSLLWGLKLLKEKAQWLCALEESLTVVTKRDPRFECYIHLYLILNYGTAPEHLKYSVQTLYGALCCFCGFPGA